MLEQGPRGHGESYRSIRASVEWLRLDPLHYMGNPLTVGRWSKVGRHPIHLLPPLLAWRGVLASAIIEKPIIKMVIEVAFHVQGE